MTTMFAILASFSIGIGIINLYRDTKAFIENKKINNKLNKDWKNKTGIYNYLKKEG